MTQNPVDARPVPFDSPGGTAGPRVPIYTPEFAADPHAAYADMRHRYGPLVPVDLAPGVPATLVVGYRTAVRILNDPDHFPADPRIWQKSAPADSPIMAMLEWRPNALRSAGIEHARYRKVNTAALDGVDLHALHATIERLAVPLINRFCETGSAELIAEYAFPLTFAVFNAMLGCPDELGERIASSIAMVYEGVPEGGDLLTGALMELVNLKRAHPGNDVATRLMQHSAGLDDAELANQIVTLYGAGTEPEQNLITNTLLLILTDDRFAGRGWHGRSLSISDALNELLFTDPPVSNFSVSYPRQPVFIEGQWLPAHHPVVISLSAANTDPEVGARAHTGNRSHLAWSAGPHACPARSMSYVIAHDAIEQLLDAIPEPHLAVPAAELTWRPGPFHRSLTALPITFPKSPPLSV